MNLGFNWKAIEERVSGREDSPENKVQIQASAQSTCLGRDFEKRSDPYHHFQWNNDNYKVC